MRSEGNCGLGAKQPPAHEPREAALRVERPEAIAWHRGPLKQRPAPAQPPLIAQLHAIIAAAHNCGLTVAADYLAEVVRRAEDRMRQETPR